MTFRRRVTTSQWRFAGGMAILIGCACTPPATMRPTPVDFSGRWAGTTSQGKAITFTVSADLRITALSVDYAFDSCSGNVTLSPNAAVQNPNGNATAVVTDTPNGPGGANRTIVNFLFASPVTATGTVQFIAFPGCASTNSPWTARR